MTYKRACDILDGQGQLHILKYYEELKLEEQRELLAQIKKIDYSLLQLVKEVESKTQEDNDIITPLQAMEIKEINSRKFEFEEIGNKALKEGKIGAVLLAGGMGTRLGLDRPKGMCDIGLTKEVFIFERIISNMLDVVNMTQTWIYLFIMTSEKNYDETVEFFRQKKYFGYDKEHITFFRQEMLPSVDFKGNLMLEEKGKIAMSPNGNGGWYSSMNYCKVLPIIEKRGIEWINVFAVDNVLQQIADPSFVGATLESGCAVGAKVVRKVDPDEKVGVMCLQNGSPSIIEYYELTDEYKETRNELGEPAYNFGVILNYLFRVKDLNVIMNEKMPLHIVKKTIPNIDKYGVSVVPDKPNGYKFETLALDMIHLSKDCLPYEVDRGKEFAPVKNRSGIDSVHTARKLLQENGIEL